MQAISHGSIRCNRCGVSMREGVCPKCGKISCHINFHWKGRYYKFYKDTHDVPLSQLSAAAMLAEINREMRDKSRPFYIEKWLNASCKQRLVLKAIESWIADCRAEVERGEMSLSVPIFYKSIAKTHFLNDTYGIGKWYINEIGVFELKQFAKSLPATLKISSRRTVINTLHVFFNWAWKEGLIREIPAFPTIKGNDSKPRIALKADDLYEALTKIPEQHRDIFEFEFKTGLRPGETCALKIKDIDLKTKEATICRTFTAHALRESDKEGHKLPIPLMSDAIEIVKKRIGNRFPDDFVFLNPCGKHYTQQNLNDVWKRYSETKITHYEATRHSYATFIVRHTDKHTAQRLLRHACPSSTERYIHMQTEYLRDKLNQIENVIDLKRKKKEE